MSNTIKKSKRGGRRSPLETAVAAFDFRRFSGRLPKQQLDEDLRVCLRRFRKLPQDVNGKLVQFLKKKSQMRLHTKRDIIIADVNIHG